MEEDKEGWTAWGEKKGSAAELLEISLVAST